MRRSLLLLSLLCLAFASAERGSLTIRSQPGVEVVWEGVPIGFTDATGTLRTDPGPFEAGSFVTIRQTWTVGSRPGAQ